MESKYTSAKKIFDFYMKKLENTETQGAQYAQQYAHVKLQSYRAECVLNSLHAYKLEVENE